jgi:hypothetical protein
MLCSHCFNSSLLVYILIWFLFSSHDLSYFLNNPPFLIPLASVVGYSVGENSSVFSPPFATQLKPPPSPPHWIFPYPLPIQEIFRSFTLSYKLLKGKKNEISTCVIFWLYSVTCSTVVRLEGRTWACMPDQTKPGWCRRKKGMSWYFLFYNAHGPKHSSLTIRWY